ncbi:hypothetical protein JCM19275_3510 [Nonlabens ulvanivorans]|uniref:Uncharacterized protein n=1 Tax=Nonlabens ulvanivorans TaxID=906888 RepID=A0A090WCC2_NONUL|nr:hypothetical protein [Nonlabens ulvanivorans]GAL74655.1 hypothetical protein JCM19275_3510 [Nonlabens ulvanivorans]
MYLTEDIKKVVRRMEKLYDSPVNVIKSKTQLSRPPTITKFFRLQSIRPSSVEIIYELCLDLIEEKEEKRSSIKKRTEIIFNEA